MDDNDASASVDPPLTGFGRSGPAGGTPDPLWKRLRRSTSPRGAAAAAAAMRALTHLTDGTGGWTYPIVAAKRCKEVCLRVADELRNQYLLGYTPSAGEAGGGWRAIRVQTSRRGVTLATRRGYYSQTS
jgi:VWFA-related protein